MTFYFCPAVTKPAAAKAIFLPLNLWDVPKNDRVSPKRMLDSFANCCSDIDYGWDVYCEDPVWEDSVYDDEIPMRHDFHRTGTGLDQMTT